MHIYGAQLQARPGSGARAGEAVARLRDAASAATGRTAYAWAVAAGAPIGSFAISARIDGVGDLIDIQMQLAADADYQQAATETADLWAGPAQTTLAQVIAVAGEPGEPQPVTVVTSATMAGGQVEAALAWSNEILQYGSNATGTSGTLATVSAGSFFDVAWINGAESGAAVDEMNAALMADSGYLSLLDKAGGLFVEGSANRTIMVRLP